MKDVFGDLQNGTVTEVTNYNAGSWIFLICA
jgi:hypothetical protein